MTEIYPPRSGNVFTTLEVFRSVSEGAELFIDVARGLAKHHLGDETTGQIPVVGEDEYVGAVNPYYSIKGAEDLLLDLLKRRSPPDLKKSNNRFSNAKGILVNGVVAPRYHQQRLQGSADPVPALEESLEWIQMLDHDIKAGEIEVPITGLTHEFSSDVRNGGGFYDLILVPDVASKVGRMLLDQARFVQNRLANESKSVAYPTGSDSLGINFMTIRRLPEALHKDEQLLHKQLRENLPFDVVIGSTVTVK